MGQTVKAKCLECSYHFTLNSGGGFFFHLLRCENCGSTKSISFEELGEIHLRYLKGLSGPYCIASATHDKNIQDNAQIEPLSKSEYDKQITILAGTCKCGGRFTFDEPPRCPKCRSTRISEGDTTIFYD